MVFLGAEHRQHQQHHEDDSGDAHGSVVSINRPVRCGADAEQDDERGQGPRQPQGRQGGPWTFAAASLAGQERRPPGL